MGDSWITHAIHFVAPKDKRSQLPKSWRSLSNHIGAIVIVASSAPQGFLFRTSIRCRRTPKRQPCTGHLFIRMFEDPEEIIWFCCECDDNGVISQWKETVSHYKEVLGDKVPKTLEPIGEFFATEEEYALLKQAEPGIDKIYTYRKEKGFVIYGTADEMDAILGAVAIRLKREQNEDTKKTLLDLFERLDEDVGISKDLLKDLESPLN